MNRSLEAYYGSPQCPEVLGDAQYARQEGKVHMAVPQLQTEGDVYSLVVVEPANTLEGHMVMTKSFPKDPAVTDEQNGLNTYKLALQENEGLQRLTRVENSGFLPDGAELVFYDSEGKYFTSTGTSMEVALQEGVEHYLSQAQ